MSVYVIVVWLMVAEEDRVNIRSILLDIEQLSAYTVVQMYRSLRSEIKPSAIQLSLFYFSYQHLSQQTIAALLFLNFFH